MRLWVAFVLRRPAVALLALALASAVLAAGLPRLETDAGYRAFLGSEHPAIRELDDFAGRFGGGLAFAAVWSCEETPACQSALDAESLAMAHAVATALARLPEVRRVDSPATSPLLVRPALGLPEARHLAPDGEPVPDLAELAPQARADPLWAGQLVSPDARAGAVVVHLAGTDSGAGARAYAALDAALAPHEARGFGFHRVGGPVEFVVAGAELADSARRLVPLMVGLVAGALLLLFRALAPAVLALGSVGLAVVWTLGLQGWLGWAQTSLTQVLPPLVLVIGVCDAVHLLAAAGARLGENTDPDERSDPEARRAAWLAGAGAVGGACAMTTLTTAAALASFAVSGLESIARFGLLAAFGTGAALLLTFALLPLAAVRLPSRRLAPRGARRALDAVVLAAGRLAERRAGALLVLAGLASLAALAGVARLEVDARFEDLYGADSQVVRWARGAAEALREPETLEIALALPDASGPASPEALAALAAGEGLAALPGLSRPLSLRTVLDTLHRATHGEPLPRSGPLVEERSGQMLRLLAVEEPDLLALFHDAESGALRVSLQAGKLPQRELRGLLATVRARLERELPPGATFRVTGPLATVAAMIDELRRTQLTSFALAGGLVLVLVALFLRSPGGGLLAMVPTALPVLWTLGAMGAGGLPLDVGSAMVAAVVLGLAVDDAIHLLAARQRRLRAGSAPPAALRQAMAEVGPALVTTSLALTAGFAALALAPWASVASFGAVSALAIGAALLATLLLLPALLSARAGRRGGTHRPPGGSSGI